MKFPTPLDELHHWLGMLTVDIQLGVPQRHLNATARLCTMLVDQLEQDPKLNREEFNRVAIQMLDLQRAIAPKSNRSESPKGSRGPVLRLVGA